jgi:hypothetical protein
MPREDRRFAQVATPPGLRQPIEPQPALLLRWAMTLVAMLRKDWLHLAPEIRLCRRINRARAWARARTRDECDSDSDEMKGPDVHCLPDANATRTLRRAHNPWFSFRILLKQLRNERLQQPDGLVFKSALDARAAILRLGKDDFGIAQRFVACGFSVLSIRTGT